MECMPREEMRKLQSLQLRQVVERAYHNTTFYRKEMQALGITPDDIPKGFECPVLIYETV